MNTTTRAAGLRMPAEWAPHERTLIAWPAREEAWRGTTIEEARDAHAAVVEAVAAFEPVTLVADPAHVADARRRVTADNVEVVALPIDDSWLRDSGPIVVTGTGGSGTTRAGIDFRFNAWGEAFEPYDKDAAIAQRLLEQLGIERFGSPLVLEGGSIAVDGEGTLVTTEQCLLNPNRNALLERVDIEQELRLQLGVEQIVWLGQGLIEDADTDGHVDNVAAFVAPGRVLLQTAPAGDLNHANTLENKRRLLAAGLDVIELSLLPRTQREDGEAVVVPYMNFYLCNGAAIVPLAQLDHDMDDEALTRLRALLPGREVVGVPGRVLALGGGGVHCITQQVPAIPTPEQQA
ncbi:agmatine/peptidylarginine deiminase [Conexibacter sp. CPCC 206217]|uniref:agmatine deiminase family protein n=1 Tax=Conexibacter sp. CPCC 206217 TaxID=3064574 RepID=UPI00271950A7|nr:agmatine deiminase family protein [Conexibacter sp. CPCC 206217]MDO8211220.1 agmatine deiminase family protein [Conexibacter sp. CPCC 206217]